jgi:nucleoside-diphosphate-sugar epimerase
MDRNAGGLTFLLVPIGFSSLNKSVVIFGCGYIGLELARQCIGSGWSVTAFTRNSQTARQAEEMGARSITGTLQSDEWWSLLDGSYDHVVNCVGAASPTLEGYQQSYLDGMHSITGWLNQNGGMPENLIFTSSSSVYPQADGALVDEESDTSGASPRGQILLEAEKVCLSVAKKQAKQSSVIRFSGLYGPGRHLLVDKIRREEPMSGSPDRFLNLIHRQDAVSALLAIMQTNIGTGIFNACDGQHATRGEIARWVAQKVGVGIPRFIDADEDRGSHRRVDNTKLRRETGWTPEYPDFQSGYQDFLASG